MNNTPAPALTRRSLLRNAAVAAGAAAVAPSLIAMTAVAPGTITAAPNAATAAAVLARGGGVLVRVLPVTPAQLALMPQLDNTHKTFADGGVELVLWDGDLQKLDLVGLRHELITPTQAISERPAGLLPQPGETDGEYRESSKRYSDDLKALYEAHKDTGRVKLLELPTPTLLGTTVYGLEIATDVDSNDGRAVVMHDGMHHCREWPAGEMPMMWAYELLESYTTDPTIQSIVDGVRTVILPLVNADGFDRTMEAAALTGETSSNGTIGLVFAISGKGDMWRKNLRAVSNEGPLAVTGPAVGGSPVGASQPDAYGVDLNRNYPFAWGDESGSSSIPETQTYRGLAPFSEPATHNVRDLVRSYLPVMHITHHTSGEQMLIPWGREPREIRSPDWPIMSGIAMDMRDGFVTPNGTAFAGNGYSPIQAYNLYPTSGTSRDWGHAVTRTIIYTFEHGSEFHGTYGPTIPAMYVKNRGAFVRHALAAMDASVVARITGAGPVGGSVELTKTFATPTNLQLSGTPVVSVGGLPPIADPTAGTVRPAEVEETISRTVTIGIDGTFDIAVPPSTRPYLINESFVDNKVGALEPYTVIVRGADGVTMYESAVTIERGFIAEIDAETPAVEAYGEIDTNPTPGIWPVPASPPPAP
ncbi:MAG: hypothetical protein ACI9AD_000408 [Nitriliruptoraceae bacterium]|jgi:hypothetical protein